MKTIKSFVIRQRTTVAQNQAIEEFATSYILASNQLEWVNSDSPLVVEIGFGTGDATWQIAKQHPEINYLAIDVYLAGIGNLLLKIKEHDLENIRIINDDAVAVLQNSAFLARLSGVHIFCPDPWPKNRHHKRRLLQPKFIIHLLSCLLATGYIHIITDHSSYMEFIKVAIEVAIADFSQKQGRKYLYHLYQDQPYNDRPKTKFEQRAIAHGGHIWDFVIYAQ